MEYDTTAMQIVREGRLLIDRYDDWLFDEFKDYIGQRILEIGCGLGNLFKHLINRECLIGIEPDSNVVASVQELYSNYPNVRIDNYSITDPSVLYLELKRLDTAISLNVFEHIEKDELGFYHTWKLLQPEGYFIVIVPSHQQLYGSMDSSIGHYRRYSKSSMKDKLEAQGFTVLSQKYINMLGALGWWVNGRLLHRRVPPEGQLVFFNHLVPLLRFMEERVSVPLGISLLTIARKD
jgi:SAM-dependent methyltransferase